MKTVFRLSAIIAVLIISNPCIRACTSFAVYTDEIWYGMNFDYSNVDIKFSIIKINDRKLFLAQFGSGGYIAGMNENGLFTNYQMLYYNGETPVFESGSNTLSLGNLNDYSINNLSTAAEIINYIGTKKIIPSYGLDLHSLFADSTSNAIVVEPFGSYNGITPLKDDFLVMANFPNYDFIDSPYGSVYGAGSGRYKTAYAYINDHKNDFSYTDGMETLSRTVQTSGDYPTQVSLLFNPLTMEIFFCMNHDFSKVWKVSLLNETIETYSGFAGNGSRKLDAAGIWSYDLSSIGTGGKKNDMTNPADAMATIYPNPTSGQLSIMLNATKSNNAIVEIFNSKGKTVLLKSLGNSSNVSIDLTGNPKGIYLTKLMLDEKVFVRKFCLE